MSNPRLSLAAILIVALSTAAATAADAPKPQTEQGILLETIRANRKAFVAVNLELNADEAKTFWPLYDKYQTEMNAIQDRALAVIEEYTSTFRDLPNDKAVQLMDSWLTTETERVQVRRTYLPEFGKILPGRTVARFYQIENKMDAVIRYDLAKAIPVIDEKATAKAK
jgi:hypothetical protein